jgi:hypothetical protein
MIFSVRLHGSRRKDRLTPDLLNSIQDIVLIHRDNRYA